MISMVTWSPRSDAERGQPGSKLELDETHEVGPLIFAGIRICRIVGLQRGAVKNSHETAELLKPVTCMGDNLGLPVIIQLHQH